VKEIETVFDALDLSLYKNEFLTRSYEVNFEAFNKDILKFFKKLK